MAKRDWKELRVESAVDTAQSYYRRAWVNETDDYYTLQSYDTIICRVKKEDCSVEFAVDNEDTVWCPAGVYWRDGRDVSCLSPTTVRHVKSFLYRYAGREYHSKKEIVKAYLQR